MKRIIAVLAVGLSLASCGVDVNSATRALKASGLKDVRITGYALFGCGKEDTFKSSFTATGADGSRVTGTVCQGMFKGTTIRFD